MKVRLEIVETLSPDSMKVSLEIVEMLYPDSTKVRGAGDCGDALPQVNERE